MPHPHTGNRAFDTGDMRIADPCERRYQRHTVANRLFKPFGKAEWGMSTGAREARHKPSARAAKVVTMRRITSASQSVISDDQPATPPNRQHHPHGLSALAQPAGVGQHTEHSIDPRQSRMAGSCSAPRTGTVRSRTLPSSAYAELGTCRFRSISGCGKRRPPIISVACERPFRHCRQQHCFASSRFPIGPRFRAENQHFKSAGRAGPSDQPRPQALPASAGSIAQRPGRGLN